MPETPFCETSGAVFVITRKPAWVQAVVVVSGRAPPPLNNAETRGLGFGSRRPELVKLLQEAVFWAEKVDFDGGEDESGARSRGEAGKARARTRAGCVWPACDSRDDESGTVEMGQATCELRSSFHSGRARSPGCRRRESAEARGAALVADAIGVESGRGPLVTQGSTTSDTLGTPTAPPHVVTRFLSHCARSSGKREVMSSPFVTVRYPDGAWELALNAKVPKVGDTLRRSGGNWVVANAAEDRNGHVIVTWRAAPKPAY